MTPSHGPKGSEALVAIHKCLLTMHTYLACSPSDNIPDVWNRDRSLDLRNRTKCTNGKQEERSCCPFSLCLEKQKNGMTRVKKERKK